MIARRLVLLLALSLVALAFAPATALAAFGFQPGAAGFDATITEAPAGEPEFGALGQPTTQAGSHPFQYTTSFAFNTTVNESGATVPDGDVKDVRVALPPGLVGNPTVVPECSQKQFTTQSGQIFSGADCPTDTQVGVASVRIGAFVNVVQPVYNLVPPPGVPARFGFNPLSLQITLTPSVDTDGDYGLDVESHDLSQARPVFSSVVTLWGDPADPEHDPFRGECLATFNGGTTGNCPSGLAPKPFLTLPTSCSGSPLVTSIVADSWQNPGPYGADGAPLPGDSRWLRASATAPALSGCNRLDFSPTITTQPDTAAADSPSGLAVDLHLPPEEAAQGTAEADLKSATVTLPAGMAVDPSSADGLGACSPIQIGLTTSVGVTPITTTAAPAECPGASQLAGVEIDTPLVDHPLRGALYLATPQQNPFGSLLALYIAVADPQTGIVVKLAGKVEPDPTTGQLTATFAQNPQLPFEDLKLDFKGGPRAVLTTPPTCGVYTATTDLTPWSSPEGADAHPSDSFQIASGPEGGGCASSESALPDKPTFEAGTTIPLAGTYSPFVLKIGREDGSQKIKSIDTTLPEGLLGRLAGIPYCSDSAIAAALGRSGAAEKASPSCPAASEVGTVTVGAGSGAPFYVTGKAYLAGPYKGAPLSLVIVTPAVAGPFDLGDVVVRTALYVDPETAQIHAVSDPLPTILQGIPLDLRSIALTMDKPNFTLNPTSCTPTQVLGAATSPLGNVAPLSQRFQVGGCGGLGFAPKLRVSLSGQTRRIGHPALKAVLTVPPGQSANIGRAQVSLPPSEFLDQGNLDKTCTRPVLQAGNCPKSTIYGRAKAWTPLLEAPLEGPVYLVGGYGYKLPALVAELDGQIRVLLVGKVDSGKDHGIRNTFEAVPDAPVSRFVLEMKGGRKYGLLENSEDICKKAQRATVKLTGQNGKTYDTTPLVANSCGEKGPKHHH